jgi:hypothetical protein
MPCGFCNKSEPPEMPLDFTVTIDADKGPRHYRSDPQWRTIPLAPPRRYELC